MLYTINGRLIARVECTDLIHCLTFSPAAEGQSVNVIAGGMSSGKIRLVVSDDNVVCICWSVLLTCVCCKWYTSTAGLAVSVAKVEPQLMTVRTESSGIFVSSSV